MWEWKRFDSKNNTDWIDKAIKDEERTRIRYNRDTTSDELEKAKDRLKDAKRWGTDRQEKVWQGKFDREYQRLKDARKDAYTKAWRDEQNDEMKHDYRLLRKINIQLNDDDPNDTSWRNNSYDAKIRRAEQRKADREAELLKRYQDELDELQRQIDDAKQAKEDAIQKKKELLRKVSDDDI